MFIKLSGTYINIEKVCTVAPDGTGAMLNMGEVQNFVRVRETPEDVVAAIEAMAANTE